MKLNDKKNTEIDDNLIDEVIRMSYGFSDEQIRAEMEDALAHPDTSPELKAPDDEFQQILQKMKERGIKPLPLESDPKAGRNAAAHHERKPLSLRRFRKIFLAAAILGVVGIGFSLSAVGKGATQYRVIDGEKNNIAWNNVQKKDDIESMTEAYETIKKELNIPSLRINYMPNTMRFDELTLSENYGIIRFECQGAYLRVYEREIGVEEYGVQGSDQRQKIEEIHNPWLNKTIDVYGEVSKTGNMRYSINIKTDEANYTVTGDIDKNDFLKIVESLYIEN